MTAMRLYPYVDTYILGYSLSLNLENMRKVMPQGMYRIIDVGVLMRVCKLELQSYFNKHHTQRQIEKSKVSMM